MNVSYHGRDVNGTAEVADNDVGVQRYDARARGVEFESSVVLSESGGTKWSWCESFVAYGPLRVRPFLGVRVDAGPRKVSGLFAHRVGNLEEHLSLSVVRCCRRTTCHSPTC